MIIVIADFQHGVTLTRRPCESPSRSLWLIRALINATILQTRAWRLDKQVERNKSGQAAPPRPAILRLQVADYNSLFEFAPDPSLVSTVCTQNSRWISSLKETPSTPDYSKSNCLLEQVYCSN